MARDDQHVRRIKRYVLARLRDELANAPRGAQARLAQRLGVSGAHLSNMLSSTPSRQPGEEFRRKVAAHWGMTYAELEAMAVGESGPPPSGSRPSVPPEVPTPNLLEVVRGYAWTAELPVPLRTVVVEQARQYVLQSRNDLPCEQWQRILTALERAALAVLAPNAKSPPHEAGRRLRGE